MITAATAQNKELLINIINSLDEKKTEQFYNLFNGLINSDLKEISNSLNIDLNSVDFAKPIDWCNSVRELGVNSLGFVWSYQESKIFGKPLNLNSLILEKMMILFKEIV